MLGKREVNQPKMIQMCDASNNNNISPELQTILCHCLSHGFRKFDDLVDYFPDDCIIIIKGLSCVFDYDANTRDMTDDQRLAYHQEHSKPIMDELQQYMSDLIDKHQVESNSALGKAILYMLKRWDSMTRFLTVPGCPIDNNIVERALKIPIRNRKNAMFYYSPYSAGISGMITSLIYTCQLNEINPQDYLVALQRYPNEIRREPEKWLPWNYQQTLTTTCANSLGHSPPADFPVAA